MRKIKADDVIQIFNENLKSPRNYDEFSAFVCKNCTKYKDLEKCCFDTNHYDCWKQTLDLMYLLKENNLTLEEYNAIKDNKKVSKSKAKRVRVSTEELLTVDCWTNKLYEAAYDIVKDRKYPIIIPSYNRPECEFLKWANPIMEPGYEWPIYIVVRESQKQLYEASEQIKYKDYIHVKAFPDELINDLGKTRAQIVKAFSKQFDTFFMWDDDISNFCHTVPFLRLNDEYKNRCIGCINFGKSIAMWQLAHEYAQAKYDILYSTGMLQAFSWVPEFGHVDRSLRILSGTPTCGMCLNAKKLNELGINFRTNKGNGHEDFDMLFRALQLGAITAEFRWFTFSNPGMSAEFTNSNTIQERFTMQQQEMKNNFGNIPWIKWTHVRNLDNVGINWNRLRKEYKEKGIIDMTECNYEDIWRDGQLLEDGKNNFSNIIKYTSQMSQN